MCWFSRICLLYLSLAPSYIPTLFHILHVLLIYFCISFNISIPYVSWCFPQCVLSLVFLVISSPHFWDGFSPPNFCQSVLHLWFSQLLFPKILLFQLFFLKALVSHNFCIFLVMLFVQNYIFMICFLMKSLLLLTFLKVLIILYIVCIDAVPIPILSQIMEDLNFLDLPFI